MLDLNALALPDLFAKLTSDDSLHTLIDLMIREDFGQAGDITTHSIISDQAQARAEIRARAAGVVAGLPAITAIIAQCRAEEFVAVSSLLADGDQCASGSTIAQLQGRLKTMLGLERMVLNLLGHLCGIATMTHTFVKAVEGTFAKICDTRKTTPGLRNLEKYAVRCGGGTLHRLGLFDALLFKDNHIAAIPPKELPARLQAAIDHGRSSHQLQFVEVEVDSMDQLQQILGLPAGFVDIVLLDNMTPAQLASAVELRNRLQPKVRLEASGGVTLANVRAIAETGVDRISIGAITHSAPWLDVGLDIR